MQTEDEIREIEKKTNICINKGPQRVGEEERGGAGIEDRNKKSKPTHMEMNGVQ